MKINLNNISLFGYHGVYNDEIENGQNFILNISVKLKEKEASTDSIGDSVDYVEIIKVVKMVFNGKRYNLLESLASDIADKILSSFKVKSISVSVQKTEPPIDVNIGSVEVTLKRSSSD